MEPKLQNPPNIEKGNNFTGLDFGSYWLCYLMGNFYFVLFCSFPRNFSEIIAKVGARVFVIFVLTCI